MTYPLKYTLTIRLTFLVSVSFTCYVHPDSKKPLEVTFYVASNEGSVLLSCTTLLALDLIQARPCLDYLPPRAKLITSAADHPDITKKTCH